MCFLRAVLAGRKRMLKANAVRYLPKVEKFRSLSIERMLDYCGDNLQDTFDCLPDDPSPTNVDRGYLFNVSRPPLT